MGHVLIINLPDIGEGVVEGEIIDWLKKEGDAIKQDEPVVVVMTDKATVELPAPKPGKLHKIYLQPGEIAIKGKPVYSIELAEGEVIPTELTVEKKEARASRPPACAPSAPAVDSGSQVLTLPSTRHLAKSLGIDLSQVHGSGKNGRIEPRDLVTQTVVTQEPEHPLRLEDSVEKPLIGIPLLMAKKMTEAKTFIPHFSYFEQADASRIVKLKDSVKQKGLEEGINVTWTPFLLRALSLTIAKFPIMNASLDMKNHKILEHVHHNIGIAMASSLGLIVPVLHDVHKMSFRELVRAFEDLKKRAQSNLLKPHEFKDGTISLSNFGVLGGGGQWATPIINHPQVAILAIARVQKQPVVKNDAVVPCDVMNLCWSFDHRVIDGDLAANISYYFTKLIENPAQLL
jgi:pyruvate dehydrogenase E2 component (dihydrolipoamide acetyltransferase)/2-oxoisovalerate dehydrogenase E2 component (dihydrolipoyl transacylase)